MSSKPNFFKKLMVQKLTTNFREAVSIETVSMCHPEKNEVLVRNKFVGVNIDDVNLTRGRYFVSGDVPFGAGFEALGDIVEIGEEVDNLTIGQNVVYMSCPYNAYSEYTCAKASDVLPIPVAKPGYLALLASGLTAVIGLDKEARIKSGDKVLITAAAGGVGHIAVQWAKAANCHVIGTCSSDEKAEILKKLGCDRVINYKKEDIGDVLSKEYEKGVDVIWETLGGDRLEAYFNNLAVKGRILIVGSTANYKTEEKEIFATPTLCLPQQLLFKSVSIHGYLVLDYDDLFPSYFKLMCERFERGKLLTLIDNGESSLGKEFFGMEGIIKGVEHVKNGKNIGKVIVRLT